MVIIIIVVIAHIHLGYHRQVPRQSQAIGQVTRCAIALVGALVILVALIGGVCQMIDIAILREVLAVPLTLPVQIDTRLQLIAPRQLHVAVRLPAQS